MEATIRSTKSKERVYGIYWVNGNRYFCCSPKNHGGFISFRESDLHIDCDEAPTGFIEIEGGLYHPAVHSSERLEGLFEHDPVSYDEFIGAVEQDSNRA